MQQIQCSGCDNCNTAHRKYLVVTLALTPLDNHFLVIRLTEPVFLNCSIYSSTQHVSYFPVICSRTCYSQLDINIIDSRCSGDYYRGSTEQKKCSKTKRLQLQRLLAGRCSIQEQRCMSYQNQRPTKSPIHMNGAFLVKALLVLLNYL